MAIDNTLVFNSLSGFCLIIATVFTYRNYSLIKTIENENHLYKYKMDNAQSLLLGIMKLIDDYQDILFDVEESKNLNRYDAIKEKEIDNQIDEVTNEFRKTTIKHSLFLPQEILDLIEKFYDGLFDDDNEVKDKLELVKFIDTKLDEIEVLAEKIRFDLGIEKLNLRLHKRIKF